MKLSDMVDPHLLHFFFGMKIDFRMYLDFMDSHENDYG